MKLYALTLFVAGCACFPEEEQLASFGRLLIPDEVSWGYGWGDLQGNPLRNADYEEELWNVGLTWYVTPREVRVLDPEETPRSWAETQRESRPVELFAGTTIDTDEAGNTIITAPQALTGGGGLGLAALAAWFIRKRFGASHTDKPQQDQ